jgi:DNA-binding transcriptional LysR family regulator
VRIELRHMRYVIAAADYRSLRRAAEALHLKQSTLSRCVARSGKGEF